MQFKDKQAVVDFVRHQLNIELPNDPNDTLNSKRKALYTYVSDADRYKVFSLLNKYNIRYESHMRGNYWILLR